MALDTTRIRRRLPQPPTDGSPSMDAPEPVAPAPSAKPVRSVAPQDGRSLRATGRTVQLNLKVSARTKKRFLHLAKAQGVLLVDLFEQAIDALEAQGNEATPAGGMTTTSR